MVVDERAGHELHAKLEEVLGADEAATLMSHLPPVGWADVATKRDLDTKLEAMEHRMIAAWRAELSAAERHILTVGLTVMLSANIALAGLAVAAAKLV